jgi:choice-of-anchor C domain-containing protein
VKRGEQHDWSEDFGRWARCEHAILDGAPVKVSNLFVRKGGNMPTSKLTGIAVAMLLITTIPAKANLVVNGSFEQGQNPGSYTNLPKGSTAITGWRVAVGNIDYIGSLWVAADGSRSVDLEGSSGTCDLATPNCPGGIAQSFATVAGQKYTVKFELAGNFDKGPVIKTVRVSAAGQSQNFSFNTKGHSSKSMGWVTDTWTFTASGPTTSLEFDSADNPFTGWGPVIDNVSVDVAAAVALGPRFLLPLEAVLVSPCEVLANRYSVHDWPRPSGEGSVCPRGAVACRRRILGLGRNERIA